MHVLLIEGRDPVGAQRPARLFHYAVQQMAAAGDPMDDTQERSLRAVGAAVTRSGTVVRIAAVAMLEEPA